MARNASLTRAWVALALKVAVSVPPLLVVTVPMMVPPTNKLPPSINAESVPVAENTSSLLAPPARTRLNVAPAKLSRADSSASKIVTSASSFTAGPFSVYVGVPSRVEARPKAVSSEPSAL